MNTPIISIIVPIYNVEPYLRKCVNSILAQTYTNIEVILVDDGSPDGCPLICDEYAEKDRRVLVIHQKNAGVSAARNAGLDTATGEYIGFVDSDDWIELDMYEVLYHVIKASDSDMAASFSCYSDCWPCKESSDNYVTFSSHEAVEKLLRNKHDLTSVWGKLYTCRFTRNIRFSTDIAVAEDALFEAETVVKSDKVAYINYQCYHYTVREDSSTHKFNENSITILDAVDRIVSIIGGFDSDMGRFGADHVPELDLHISKQLEEQGILTKEAYAKIVFHIKKYININSWKLLTLKEKCWVILLLFGRVPFITGRKVFLKMKVIDIRSIK